MDVIAGTIKSPLNLAAWVMGLTDYPDRDFVKYIIDGIINGVKIGYTGERKYSEYLNWPSVDMFYEHVLASIHRDISLGRKLGPWDSPPLPKLLGRQWALSKKSLC